MKKLALVLVGILALAGMVAAQDVAITGSATFTAGFDLATSQFGFKNATSTSLDVRWDFDAVSASGSGFIELSDLFLELEDTDTINIDAPDISAGLIIDPLTITLSSAPSMGINNASGYVWHAAASGATADNFVNPALTANNGASTGADPTTGTLFYDTGDAGVTVPTGAIDLGGDVYFVPDAASTTSALGFQGMTISADLAPLAVDVYVVTDGTWVENTDNDLAFGGKVTASLGDISVNAGAIAGPLSAMDLGFSAGLDGAFGPIDLVLGFDGSIPDGGELAFDALALIGLDLGVASLSTRIYYGSEDIYAQAVLGVSAVENLSLTNTTQAYAVLNALEWWNEVDLSYTLGDIAPFATFAIDDANSIDLTAGVNFNGLFDNTVVTLQYAATDIANDNGKITLATVITY